MSRIYFKKTNLPTMSSENKKPNFDKDSFKETLNMLEVLCKNQSRQREKERKKGGEVSDRYGVCGYGKKRAMIISEEKKKGDFSCNKRIM